MKGKTSLEEGELWVVANVIGPYDGYGVTLVDAVSPRTSCAISFYASNECVFSEGDKLVVFSSTFDDKGCKAHFVRPRDLFQVEVQVYSCSWW
jgi:hypothetical protein